MADLDPSAPSAKNGHLFGLPSSVDNANIVVIPVPWEVTASYRCGTAKAPNAILQASYQVDLEDPHVIEAWKAGLALDEPLKYAREHDHTLRKKTKRVIVGLESGTDPAMEDLNLINTGCAELVNCVQNASTQYLRDNKLVGVLGGDHSTPLGLIQALSERTASFGILQIDAHMDLRKEYQGLTFSHASIMHNVLELPQVSKLVQVGIRDYCPEEVEFAKGKGNRVVTVFDHHIAKRQYMGETWGSISEFIVNHLPAKVYISFDIDGLDPSLCPNTGTPVPGGLEFNHVTYLLQLLVSSGRTIIGFDLCEVGANEWDANVGARILYRLSNSMALSNGLV